MCFVNCPYIYKHTHLWLNAKQTIAKASTAIPGGHGVHSVHSLSGAGAADGFRLESENYGTSLPERCLLCRNDTKTDRIVQNGDHIVS